MNETEERLRSIEKEIDCYYKSHDFLSLPTSIAIQYLLLAFEYSISPLLPKFPMIQYASADARFQITKNALMESANWVGEIMVSRENKVLVKLDKNLFDKANDFFSLGDSYHGAVSAFTMWSRGLATAKLLDQDTVYFEYNREQIRYDMLDFKLSGERKERTLAQMSEKDSSIYRRACKAVENTVKQVDEHNISYSLRDVDNRQIMDVTSKMTRNYADIPHNWKLSGISLDEFYRFWSAIVSMGILHQFAVRHALEEFSFKNDLLTSSVIIRPIKDWNRQIARWLRLTENEVVRMLSLHTYSSLHRKPDIVLTPFIRVTDSHLAICPSLITTNNFARNLLKHAAKNYRHDFDSNSFVFEDKMIQQISEGIHKVNIQIKTKIKMPQELPNIDICLYDRQKSEIMICECRWTIGAADPYEIADKVDIEKEKIKQTTRLREFLLAETGHISQIIGCDKKIESRNMFFVVVFENHAGSAIGVREDLPIVDMGIFLKLINEGNSLSESFSEIKMRDYLPRENMDFRVKDETIQIGKYKFVWTGFHPM